MRTPKEPSCNQALQDIQKTDKAMKSTDRLKFSTQLLTLVYLTLLIVESTLNRHV